MAQPTIQWGPGAPSIPKDLILKPKRDSETILLENCPDLKYITSSQGQTQMLYKDFLFNKNNATDTHTYW